MRLASGVARPSVFTKDLFHTPDLGPLFWGALLLCPFVGLYPDLLQSHRNHLLIFERVDLVVNFINPVFQGSWIVEFFDCFFFWGHASHGFFSRGVFGQFVFFFQLLVSS